ncbi:MAG: S41 family peptidase [Pseudomonadota bacterium]
MANKEPHSSVRLVWRGSLTISLAAACTTPLPAQSSAPDGYWLSDGYGYFYEYRDGRIADFWDVTDDFCRPVQPDELELENHELPRAKFRVNTAGNQMFLSTVSDPHEIRFHKVDGLPGQCNQTIQNTPTANFDAFAGYFDQHYPFFELHDVLWAEQVSKARAKITPDTSNEELFEIFKSLIKPIKDVHLSIEGEIGGEKKGFRSGHSTFEASLENYAKAQGISFHDAVLRHQKGYWETDIKAILGKEPASAGDDAIRYGITQSGVGYIAIVAQGGYSGGDTVEEDIAAAHTIMDRIIGEFHAAQVRAVVIDVSVNMGGYDAVSRAIASHFADERRLAYSKQAADADDPLMTAIHIAPAKGKRFTGPVYVMTGDATRSAGETFTLALRAFPHVTHVGERTRGSLSDQFYKALPNGWYLSLGNELYTDKDGIEWEKVGVEPHIAFTVFDPSDPTQGRIKAVRTIEAMVDQAEQ